MRDAGNDSSPRTAQAVPDEELAKKDRERQKKAEEYARRLSAQPEKERARQNREWDKDRREMAKTVDDIFRVYDVRMDGREAIDGHATIRFSLVPTTRRKASDARGWRHASLHGHGVGERVGLRAGTSQVEAIDTVGIGLGLLARVHKGARIAFERRKVNDEVWLPATASYSFNARVALLKMLRRDATLEFANYRKFTVDTSSSFAAPQ